MFDFPFGMPTGETVGWIILGVTLWSIFALANYFMGKIGLPIICTILVIYLLMFRVQCLPRYIVPHVDKVMNIYEKKIRNLWGETLQTIGKELKSEKKTELPQKTKHEDEKKISWRQRMNTNPEDTENDIIEVISENQPNTVEEL